MSESQEPQIPFNKHTGIRAMGERDRSPEHKEARSHFINSVNGFVHRIKALQEEGRRVRLPNGLELPVEETPRITRTFMGKTPRGFHAYSSNYTPGLSLVGDGETSPLDLQAVIPFTDGSLSIVEISGTNPLARCDETGKFAYRSRSDGDIVTLSVTRATPTEDGFTDSQEKYAVLGDGTMQGTSQPINLEAPDKPSSFNQRAIDSANVGCMVLAELGQSMGIE
jgi:hypothetical protein